MFDHRQAIDDGLVYLSGVNEKKLQFDHHEHHCHVAIKSFLIIIETFVFSPLSSYVHQKNQVQYVC
jgi:hypothetical protein